MKFDLSQVPGDVLRDSIEVGDVFPARGGGRGSPKLWLVAAIHERTVHLLGLDGGGEIVSTTSYAMHVLESRARVGRVREFAELRFEVQP